VQTGGSTLQAQQPLVNVARVTVQALAAVLGGTQSLHTNGYDEALALPTAAAATLALRTQQVVGFESGVSAYADPLAGSVVVEALTDALEADATRLIEEVDALGGAVAAIEAGFYQDRIGASAYAAQLAIESGEAVIVGVNRFTTEERFEMETKKVPDSIRVTQSERLAALRQSRDAEAWTSAMDAVETAARGTGNLMPHLLRAVEARATVGEISHRLRAGWGEYAG
ncbi:MAG TPA: methylmalonyl-CoA mutase family protein, partial [Rubricoccaceae bacterium]